MLKQRRSNSLTSRFIFLLFGIFKPTITIAALHLPPVVWPAQKGNKDDKYVMVV